jgi:vacuolar-type H+-ATPase subunit E/Vma4
MSLERLVEEIRSRGEAELKEIETHVTNESAKIVEERERRIREIGDEAERQGQLEADHERTQRVAAAKLRARQKLYEARETRLENALGETRELLRAYASSPQYPLALERMYRVAQTELGRDIVVRGRAEDAAVLQKLAGTAFQPHAEPIVGGLIAETPDGRRRLNLSFDELLRLREDRVRELLS